MTKCPICEKGELKKGRIKETMFGVFLGEFPAEICSSCNESFTDEENTQKIQELAKEKRL
jgi:YgiT-type zinc finger domain-containing protein